jgi:hypothetical protein
MEFKNKSIIERAVQKWHTFVSIGCLFTMALTSTAGAEESHHSGTQEFHRHHASLILGNTFDEHGENGFSVGGDYEYRVNKWFGLGVGLEYAGGDFEHVLIGIPLFFHPNEHWRFAVAAATEIHKEGEHEEREREAIVRTGVGYQFHIGNGYSISPEFNVDFSEHETLYVIGLSFGFGW